jgi:iron complex transport system ATP-binding protein
MGRRPHIGWRSNEKDNEKVLDVLQMLKIEYLAMRDINEISGGQQQKVFIARALVQEPDVLLLDEPTSNLDIKHQLDVMDAIKKLVSEKEISAIMAIHDLNLGSRYSDRIIMMNGGTIVSAGNPSLVLNAENIKHVYGVEAFVRDELGRPYIVPVRPISPNGGENEV